MYVNPPLLILKTLFYKFLSSLNFLNNVSYISDHGNDIYFNYKFYELTLFASQQILETSERDYAIEIKST